MIRLTCTNCKQVLTIDDAFAGGVCRCQFCGTIQTVPLQLKGTGGPAKPAVAKTLYRNDARGVGSGSGLDQLADIVTSSGLAGSGLRSRSEGGVRTSTLPSRDNKTIYLMVAAAVIVLLIGFIIIHEMGGSKPDQPPQNQGGTHGLGTGSSDATNNHSGPSLPNGSQGQTVNPPSVPASPNFCGMPLSVKSVVYVIDNGNSAQSTLADTRAAVIQSIRSLGPERQFKVIFWRTDEDSPTYPPKGLANATATEADKCKDAIGDASPLQMTTADAALKAAVAAKPEAIVLITSKADSLPPDFRGRVKAIRGNSPVRIYTAGIDGDSDPDPSKGILATTAADNRGQFLNLGSDALKHFGS